MSNELWVMSNEQWVVSDEIWHKLMSNPFGGIGVSENLGRCTQRPYILATHYSLLTAHYSRSAVICRICVISVQSKFFTKPYFCINPAGKSKVPSWKIFISQQENYFFSVGKSKFRSRAILDDILGLFLNYFKWFLFILTPTSGLWTKVKMFDIELLTAHLCAIK